MVSSQSQYNTTLSFIFLDTTQARKCCKSWKIEKLNWHGIKDTCTAVKPTHDYFSDPNFVADINELLTGLEFQQLVLCRGWEGGGGRRGWALAFCLGNWLNVFKVKMTCMEPGMLGQGALKLIKVLAQKERL